MPCLVWPLGASLIGVSVSADEQATNPLSSANTAESVSQNPDLVVTETTVATTKANQVAANQTTDSTATVTADSTFISTRMASRPRGGNCH